MDRDNFCVKNLIKEAKPNFLTRHLKGVCSISVIVGIGIWVLVLLRSNTQTNEFFLPKLLRNNPSPACDSLIGDLKYDIDAGMGLNILTGEIFWEKNSTNTCRIASLTKLMVVLIAMEKIDAGELKLSELITVTPEATQMWGSQVYLKEGEKFRMDELLKAMMIYSANDASYLVAQYIGGTEEIFVRKMNDKARSMGLKDTYFSNSTGLPPPKNKNWAHNISSCVDLAYIALEVIQYPEVMEWAGTRIDYIRNGEFKLQNWNGLLKECEFVDGLKTGFYSEAGYNIVATSTCGDKKVMAIVLGAKSAKVRNKVAKLIIEYGLYN